MIKTIFMFSMIFLAISIIFNIIISIISKIKLNKTLKTINDGADNILEKYKSGDINEYK